MPPKLLVEYTERATRDIAYATPDAAGIDLEAAYQPDGNGVWLINPGESITVPTGVKIAIPDGYYGRVVPRSGLGFKKDIACHIGTIDSDYRGEVMVRLRNHGQQAVTFEPGDRIAQLIIQPYLQATIIPVHDVNTVSPTERGEHGFGSTGA